MVIIIQSLMLINICIYFYFSRTTCFYGVSKCVSSPLGHFFWGRLVQKFLHYYIPRFADYKFRNRLWLCLISQSFKLRKHTLAPVVSCHAGKISKHSEQMCAKYRTRSLFNFKNNCDEWLQQEKRLKNYQFPKISERKNAVTYGNGP